MAEICIINLHVRKPGERTQRLLQGAAKRLHFERISPKQGHAPLRFFNTTPQEAWDAVYAALEAEDPEWQELVTIGQRPKDRRNGPDPDNDQSAAG